jgi:hypothetical protein
MIVAAWALVVCGLSTAMSQIPTLHPDLGVLALGLAVAFIGGLMIADHGPRGRRR